MELSDEEIERLSPTLDNRYSDVERQNLSETEKDLNASNDLEDKGTVTKRRIDPTKARTQRKSRPKLDAARLRGPKGLHTIETYFKDFKFQGKGHERTYLKGIMKRLEYWAHRNFPRYLFEDFLERAEALGNKKEVQVVIRQCRLDMLTGEDDKVKSSDDEKEAESEIVTEKPLDAFDALINENRDNAATPNAENVSSPIATVQASELSNEIKARIEANRQLALQRKMARAKERFAETHRSSEVAVIRTGDHIKVSDNAKITNELAVGYVETTKLENSRVPSAPATLQIPLDEEIIEMEQECAGSTHKQNTDSSLANVHSTSRVESTVNMNATSRIEDIIEESEESLQPKQSEETMEIPTERETEIIPYPFERIDSPPNKTQDLEKPSDSERLLTHEELLEAIDGAVEEIIRKK